MCPWTTSLYFQVFPFFFFWRFRWLAAVIYWEKERTSNTWGQTFHLERLCAVRWKGDYYITVRRVLTNIFGHREVMAYVTSPAKDSSTRRLFFSTVFPQQLEIFCTWQEKSLLNQTGISRLQYIPLLLYGFRRNIEVRCYEQKTFWSLYSYRVRSQIGIEMLVNLINILYCTMKILSYQDETFSKYAQNCTFHENMIPEWGMIFA